MKTSIHKLFIAPKGGAEMTSVEQVEAVAERGLNGDRYCAQTGHWQDVDQCQVTLIEKEALDEIHVATGVNILNGEHRRNIVTEGIRLHELNGRTFKIGEALFVYERDRPPCGYIASLTSRKMTKALWGRSGICVQVIKQGHISVGDTIDIIDTP
ncbi:MAG: MOSC domain-containing protein [Rhodospirillaceae bacterium]|nr:MOSC domain-containing protein [Rhodospirillaceae bacterium]